MATIKYYPPDWNEVGSTFHGVSRNNRLRAYLTPVSLNGQQFYFGPFYTRQEAAVASDALTHYFLPFVRSTPKLNCAGENFTQFDDKETEERYGADRLVRLHKRFTDELVTLGVDLEANREARLEYIRDNLSFKGKQERLLKSLGVSRRNALMSLEKMSFGLVSSHQVREHVNALAIPPEFHNHAKVQDQMKTVLRTYETLKLEFTRLIELSKTTLDLDPNTTTP